MATLRTLIAPRFNDAYSFSGVGRWQYQVAPVNPRTGQPTPTSPPKDGAPVPIKG